MSVEYLQLLDWKRRIFELYTAIRQSHDPRAAWTRWRTTRDDLFATHGQSPVPPAERPRFQGLRYYDYDLNARVLAETGVADLASYDIHTPVDLRVAAHHWRGAESSVRCIASDHIPGCPACGGTSPREPLIYWLPFASASRRKAMSMRCY